MRDYWYYSKCAHFVFFWMINIKFCVVINQIYPFIRRALSPYQYRGNSFFWSLLRLQSVLFTQELLISWGAPIWLPEGTLHHLKECFGQYI